MKNDMLAELLKLIQENPDLPVIPFVEQEVVADYDPEWWMGSWGGCKVGEYLMPRETYGEIIFRDEESVSETLEDYLTQDEWEDIQNGKTTECLAHSNLPWKKAIIVYITLPEA